MVLARQQSGKLLNRFWPKRLLQGNPQNRQSRGEPHDSNRIAHLPN